MTILLTTVLIFSIIAASVTALVACMFLAEQLWRRAAEADIVRRSEEMLRQAALGMA